MASLHLTTPSNSAKLKKSEAALEEVLNQVKMMQVDTSLTAQMIIDGATHSGDLRFVKIHNNWDHWTEFMNQVNS